MKRKAVWDWHMGDFALLNSGSPTLTVVGIDSATNMLTVAWIRDGVEDRMTAHVDCFSEPPTPEPIQ